MMANLIITIFLILASFMDIRTRKVSNWLTLPLLFGALIHYMATDFTAVGVLVNLAIYLILNLLVHRGLLGGADAKVFLVFLFMFGLKAFFICFVVAHYLSGFYRLFRRCDPSIAFMPMMLMAFLITNYGGFL